MTIKLPMEVCEDTTMSGYVAPMHERIEYRKFRTRSDSYELSQIRPWLTYIVKVYVWCGEDFVYFEKQHFSGPGGWGTCFLHSLIIMITQMILMSTNL